MKVTLLVMIIFSLISCKHEQELYNSKAFEKDKNSKVEDPGILIFEAVAQGDLEKVKLYLQQGVGVNDRGAGGSTLLIKAVVGIRYNIIDYLIQQGADPHLVDDDGLSALMYAEKQGDDVALIVLNREELSPEVLGQLLVERAVDGLKPLLVRWLLGKGADPNYNLGTLRRPKTPMIVLVTKGRVEVKTQVEIAKMLVSHSEFYLDERWKNLLIDWCEGTGRVNYHLPEISKILRSL